MNYKQKMEIKLYMDDDYRENVLKSQNGREYFKKFIDNWGEEE